MIELVMGYSDEVFPHRFLYISLFFRTFVSNFTKDMRRNFFRDAGHPGVDCDD